MEDAKIKPKENVIVHKGLFHYLFLPVILLFKGIFYLLRWILLGVNSFFVEITLAVKSSNKSKLLKRRLYKKPIDEELV